MAMKHLVEVLQLLARGGRTIVCTVHQPSASLFQQFDHVYVLCSGSCVYQGAAQQLVPFLESCQMNCPKHYNPADFGKSSPSTFQYFVLSKPYFVQRRNKKVMRKHCTATVEIRPGTIMSTYTFPLSEGVVFFFKHTSDTIRRLRGVIISLVSFRIRNHLFLVLYSVGVPNARPRQDDGSGDIQRKALQDV